MFQGEGRASKIEIAISRYKQGRCPCCGKSLGEPRGVEYRARSQDLFCHGCKNRWPIEVEVAALRDDLSLLEPIQAEIPSLPVSDLTPTTRTIWPTPSRLEEIEQAVPANRFEVMLLYFTGDGTQCCTCSFPKR